MSALQTHTAHNSPLLARLFHSLAPRKLTPLIAFSLLRAPALALFSSPLPFTTPSDPAPRAELGRPPTELRAGSAMRSTRVWHDAAATPSPSTSLSRSTDAPNESPTTEITDANDLYPCQPSPTVLHFFTLATDIPSLRDIHPALHALHSEIVYGPRSTPAFPQRSFVTIRSPRSITTTQLESALRKGRAPVEVVTAIAFDGRTGKDHDAALLHLTKRDLTLGITGDLRWYDTGGSWSQLFGRPAQLKPEFLLERYQKANEPYGKATFGHLARERFTWAMTRSPDTRLRAKLTQELEQIPGVESAAIFGNELTITVALRDLEISGDIGTVPAGNSLDDEGQQAPRVAFDAGAIYEVLQWEGLVQQPNTTTRP